jgi:hypothetical protein
MYPDVPGGGTYHVHAMSRDQAAMGHEVTVLTIAAEPDLPHVEERHGYTVVRFPATLSPLGNDVFVDLARYLASLDESKFDVMHAHSHEPRSLLAGRAGAAVRHLPSNARPMDVRTGGRGLILHRYRPGPSP